MDDSRMEREALDLVAAGQPVNGDGARLLLGWLQRAPVNHPDRDHVQATVDRFYTAQPGAGAPVHLRDTFFVGPHGSAPSTRGMRGER